MGNFVVPDKWNIAGTPVSPYLFCAVSGIILAIVLFLIHLKKEGRAHNKTVTKAFLTLALSFLALMISAFLFDGLFHSVEKGSFSFGGISWLGGLLGYFPAFFLLFHFLVPEAKGKEIDYLNYLMAGLALGHGIGRVGCFFAGCCYGLPTDAPIGVIYPENSSAAIAYPGIDGRSLPVMPVQLFEAAFEWIMGIFLILAPKKIRPYRFAVYAFGYGTYRFIQEFFRGDDRGATGFFLSPSQLMSILLIGYGVFSIILVHASYFKTRIDRWKMYSKAYEDVVYSKKASLLIDEQRELCDKGSITPKEFHRLKKNIYKVIAEEKGVIDLLPKSIIS